MCLNKLLKDVEITETVGYKVFDTNYGKLSTPVMHFEVCVGKEYKAKAESILTAGEKYHSGFHIFLKLEDAKRYMNDLYENETCVIRKVSFRNILAAGLDGLDGLDDDDDMLCVVAQYMTVLEEPCHVSLEE